VDGQLFEPQKGQLTMSELTELKTESDVPATDGSRGELNQLDAPEGAAFILGGSRQLGDLPDQTLSWPCYGVSVGPFDAGDFHATVGVEGSPGTSTRSAVGSSSKDGRLGTGPPRGGRLTLRPPRWLPPATPSPLQLAGSITRRCSIPMPGLAPRTTCRWARSN
jgi:hypothetical protein